MKSAETMAGTTKPRAGVLRPFDSFHSALKNTPHLNWLQPEERENLARELYTVATMRPFVEDLLKNVAENTHELREARKRMSKARKLLRDAAATLKKLEDEDRVDRELGFGIELLSWDLFARIPRSPIS